MPAASAVIVKFVETFAVTLIDVGFPPAGKGWLAMPKQFAAGVKVRVHAVAAWKVMAVVPIENAECGVKVRLPVMLKSAMGVRCSLPDVGACHGAGCEHTSEAN